jgi:hypothetical protein
MMARQKQGQGPSHHSYDCPRLSSRLYVSLSLQRPVRALPYVDTIARVKMWDRVSEE